ncbi:MAG TPA: DUF29 domain-containing protein [Stellaceae bacterium]|jgi:hypothetical protein|nr:DUF29 domain-containing protein [Stellaceae bacterium]
MSGNAARLYEEDFVRWTEEQAAALRQAAGLATNLPLDWANLAEEIDSLGRSQSRELGSRIAVVIEHLIKLETSPAIEPRSGWIDTIGRERRDIEDLLNDSPSLRSGVAGMIAREMPRTIRLVARSLRNRGETNPETIARIERVSYAEEQILGDWFPGDAPLPADGERDQRASNG